MVSSISSQVLLPSFFGSHLAFWKKSHAEKKHKEKADTQTMHYKQEQILELFKTHLQSNAFLSSIYVFYIV